MRCGCICVCLCADGICIYGVYTCDVCVYTHMCVWCICVVCVYCVYIWCICVSVCGICVYVYVYICTHTGVCVVHASAHKCTCEWRPEVNVRYFLNCSPLYPRRQGFSVNLEFID